MFNVHKDPHQLRDGQGRMSVVQLYRDLRRKKVKRRSHGVARAELWRLESTHNIRQGGRYEEVLLL